MALGKLYGKYKGCWLMKPLKTVILMEVDFVSKDTDCKLYIFERHFHPLRVVIFLSLLVFSGVYSSAGICPRSNGFLGAIQISRQRRFSNYFLVNQRV